MGESLLSASEILLFGREVIDLQIRVLDPDAAANHTATVATTKKLSATHGHPTVNGVELDNGDKVLVQHQHGAAGLYQVAADNADWGTVNVTKGQTIRVEEGGLRLGGTLWVNDGTAGNPKFRRVDKRRKVGKNNHLLEQLEEDPRFARIYGFSFEGTYFELPNPTLFLVHGEGESATDNNLPGGLASRAPNDPSRSGVAAADYQIADDIRVWAYDKADYTIRMDVATGMFEQVLLDLFFEVDLPMMAGAKVSGAKVSGAKVAGAKVAGAKVSGAKVAGAKVSGAKVGGFGD